jgi:apolipoprotein N-acyltransferase
VRDPAPTLMVRWGDWVGRAAAGLFAGLALLAVLRRWTGDVPVVAGTATLPERLAVLPPATRAVAGLLRLISRGGALAMGAAILWGDAPANTLALLRVFMAVCLIPEAAAWLLLRACAARLTLADGLLVMVRGKQRLEIPLHEIATVEPWRLPLPAPGAALRMRSGERWPLGLCLRDPWALASALNLIVHEQPRARGWWAWARSRAQPPSRLAQPAFKLLLLPLVLAIAAFQLHQRIAYGSPLGEFYRFGLGAYLAAFGLWWAAWMAGVVLCAAAVRALIDLSSLAVGLLRPRQAAAVRAGLEQLGLLALYLGLPAWLALRAMLS